jgi:hypothetical protein
MVRRLLRGEHAADRDPVVLLPRWSRACSSGHRSFEPVFTVIPGQHERVRLLVELQHRGHQRDGIERWIPPKRFETSRTESSDPTGSRA